MATPIEQFESFLTKGGIDYVRFDRWREGEEGQFVTFRSKYGQHFEAQILTTFRITETDGKTSIRFVESFYMDNTPLCFPIRTLDQTKGYWNSFIARTNK